MQPPTQKLSLFTQHSRTWQTNRYVYPVISRRSKGLSIGINLNPDKICNFDCIYCCVDRKVPATIRDVDLPILEAELDHLLTVTTSGELWTQPPFDSAPQPLRRLNDIAFSGDGEPTSYPQFPQACQLAATLLASHHCIDTKIVLITNATLLHRPQIQSALKFLDQHNGEIWAKLDAGTEAYYRQVERTTIPLSRVLENIRDAGRSRPIVIQSLFMKIHGQGPDQREIAEYITRLTELAAAGCQLKLIQIYTIARGTAETWVTPLEDQEVDAIVQQARQQRFNVEAYYGPT